MKTVIIVITGVCLVGAAGFLLGRARQTAPTTESAIQQPPSATADAQDPVALTPALEPKARQSPEPASTPLQPAVAPNSPASAPPAKPPVSLAFNQALDNLVAPQASYQQKQAAWQQLRDAGKLEQAITELEQRALANPSAAEYPATLGQACLQKAGTLKDVREQGILGLKADQSFDAALNLDPDNWEARFWKAAAMSYWPSQLNKGQEVVERFLDLVKLQETRAPEPQFAQTYVLLGEQYQKLGYPQYALQTWQRGVGLFPNDPRLGQKLTAPQSAEQATAR